MIKKISVICIMLICIYSVWNIYQFQNMLAHVEEIDPTVGQRVENYLKPMPDFYLIHVLKSGNWHWADSAKVILIKRGDAKNFNAVAKLASHKEEDVRGRALSMLQHLDLNKALPFYLEHLKHLDKSSIEYWQCISIMAKYKYRPAFDYVVDYLKYAIQYSGQTAAAVDDLAAYEDEKALSTLREFKQGLNLEKKRDQKLSVRIDKAITTLESIKK